MACRGADGHQQLLGRAPPACPPIDRAGPHRRVIARADPALVPVRITIRVKPGSARPGIGGEHAGALVVRVSARAVDGRATEAALAAVADAFGVRRGAVSLVSGASSPTKVVDIDSGDPRVLADLLAGPGHG